MHEDPLHHSSSNEISGDTGFTMIELLVVSMLLAMLAGILFGTIGGILNGRELIKGQEEIGRTAQHVFERMGRELTGRVAIPLSETEERGSQQGTAFGASQRVYLKSTNKTEGSNDSDSIRFVSSNAAQAAFNQFNNYGLVEVEYRLEELSKQNRGPSRRGDEDRVLIRAEIPAGVEDQDLRKKRQVIIPLADGVRSLNFRYLQDGKWQDQWQAQRSSIPEAVEITLTLSLEPEENQEEEEVLKETFRTAIALSRPLRRGSSGTP